MKAIVLSAGLGERLRPLTDKIPKPMLEVGGRPLIHYPLMLLRSAGITEVAINVHHLPGEIERGLGNGAQLGMKITYAPEAVLLGTGGPLAALSAYFGGEAFVVLNCDTIIDLALAQMIAFHRERNALATLALIRPDDPDIYSQIQIDSTRRIRRMRLLKSRAPGEFKDYPAMLAPDLAASLEAYMYCGVLICDPEALVRTPKAARFGLMDDLFAPLLTEGVALFGFVHDGYFRTVDDLSGYHALRTDFAHNPPPLRFLN